MRLTKSQLGKIGNINSQKTHQAQKAQRIEDYLKLGKVCFTCLSVLSYEKRKDTYCSRKCAVTQNNMGKQRNPPKTRANCLYCNKQVQHLPNRTCNLECHRNYQRQQIEIRAKTTSTLSALVLRKILIRENRRCNKCLLTHWNGELIPIELDHIDGNFRNNNYYNVRLLCPNCHAQTPTYKIKNKGHGRPNRK